MPGRNTISSSKSILERRSSLILFCLGGVIAFLFLANLIFQFSLNSSRNASNASSKHSTPAAPIEDLSTAMKRLLNSFTHLMISINDFNKLSLQKWTFLQTGCLSAFHIPLKTTLTELNELLSRMLLDDLDRFLLQVESPSVLLNTEQRQKRIWRRRKEGVWNKPQSERISEAHATFLRLYKGQFCSRPLPSSYLDFSS